MRIVLYDFDNTLSLWKLHPAAKRQYEESIKKILQHQGENEILRVSTSTVLQTCNVYGFLKDANTVYRLY